MCQRCLGHDPPHVHRLLVSIRRKRRRGRGGVDLLLGLGRLPCCASSRARGLLLLPFLAVRRRLVPGLQVHALPSAVAYSQRGRMAGLRLRRQTAVHEAVDQARPQPPLLLRVRTREAVLQTHVPDAASDFESRLHLRLLRLSGVFRQTPSAALHVHAVAVLQEKRFT